MLCVHSACHKVKILQRWALALVSFDSLHSVNMGVQWISGRVFDSRLRGRGCEPHWHHCVVVLEQDTFILA